MGWGGERNRQWAGRPRFSFSILYDLGLAFAPDIKNTSLHVLLKLFFSPPQTSLFLHSTRLREILKFTVLTQKYLQFQIENRLFFPLHTNVAGGWLSWLNCSWILFAFALPVFDVTPSRPHHTHLLPCILCCTLSPTLHPNCLYWHDRAGGWRQPPSR